MKGSYGWYPLFYSTRLPAPGASALERHSDAAPLDASLTPGSQLTTAGSQVESQLLSTVRLYTTAPPPVCEYMRDPAGGITTIHRGWALGTSAMRSHRQGGKVAPRSREHRLGAVNVASEP